LEAFGHILNDGSYVYRFDHVMYQNFELLALGSVIQYTIYIAI